MKRNAVTLVVFAVMLIVGIRYHNDPTSAEDTLEKVMSRQGYELKLMEAHVPVEWFIRPEWIPFDSAEEQKLSEKLFSRDGTVIYLDTVWNRGEDIYFTFHVTYEDLKRESGTFLFNGILNENGSVTVESPWPEGSALLSKSNRVIEIGQTGIGPGSDFGFGIDIKQKEGLREGFRVTYSGMNLYQYSRT